MKPLALDTPQEIEEIVIEGYRQMTPAQKLQRVIELGTAAQAMAAARGNEYLDTEFPELTTIVSLTVTPGG